MARMNISEFLRQRWDEHESEWGADERFIAAAREILSDHGSEFDNPQRHCTVCASGDGNGEGWPCRTVRLLAAVYFDHPDYRQEWRPVEYGSSI